MIAATKHRIFEMTFSASGIGSAGKANPAPIVTKIGPGRDFYPAEDYHQDFLTRNPRNRLTQYRRLSSRSGKPS